MEDPERTCWLVVFVLAFVTSGINASLAPSDTTQTGSVQREVFRAGEGGYFCFRIPAILFTVEETLLAFSEGRGLQTGTCSDHGPDVRIVVKRSSDFGETWSNLSVVHSEVGHIIGEPLPLPPPSHSHTHTHALNSKSQLCHYARPSPHTARV